MRKKGQHCSEGAQGGGKENEERKLFFGVNGEFMMTCKVPKEKCDILQLRIVLAFEHKHLPRLDIKAIASPMLSV